MTDEVDAETFVGEEQVAAAEDEDSRRVDAPLSGNPNLYLRRLNLPTVEPYTTYDCALASGANTEYGNWVPTDGRTQKQLTPGRWYLAVKAESGSNCRFRLKLSTGSVQDLALNGGTFNNQVLAAGDWRYYRVQIPWNAPANWNFTYNQSQGDVDLYVRDTVPPGDWSSPGSIYHWANDYKNTSPYPSYPSAGTFTVQTPQLRPGHIYYLGFRSNSDATFNVSSAISGGTLGDFPVLSCYGGTATTNLPGNSAVTFRIPVPTDAVRWQHFTTNAAAVQVWLAQGSLPSPSYDNWSGTSGNGSLSQLLNGWPWVPGDSCFLTATNTGGTAQPFTLVLNARTAATDDSDNDGLADAWEMLYVGNTSSTGTSDPDGDGNNLVEFTDGTNPNDGNSAKYFLSVSATNGVVQRSLTLPKYTKGTNVLLTAVADPGFSFAGWADAFIGTTNPLSVTLSNNITLTALFTQPIRITVLTAGMTDGAFPLWITGVAGQGGIVVEASTNLVNWIPIYTNFPSGNGFDFIDYAKTNIPIRFYRAKALPAIMAGPSFITAVSGSAFGGAGYSFGWQFSVSVPVQITALGCFDHGGDGLGEPHLVKIWDSGGSVVCQGTASTTNRLQDGFRYTTDLNGTTWLNPGSYTIAAYFPTTSDLIVFSASRSVLTTPPEVTYGEGRYGPGTASVPAAHYEGQDEGYFGPNFLFTDL